MKNELKFAAGPPIDEVRTRKAGVVMATSITSGGETLLSSLHAQTSGPVELSSPPRSTGKTVPPDSDTVKLSLSAQIRQLVQQGQSANQIADALGLTANLVNSYLYVPLSAAIVVANPVRTV